jgi:glucokinase
VAAGGVRIGVDLGGTSAKIGLVRAGVLERKAQIGNPHRLDKCVAAIAAAVRDLTGGVPPEFVGVGLPGVTNDAQRVILRAPNLAFLEHQEFAFALERALGVPVRLENDANVAALGEARFGAGAQFPDFLLATLGTGVGGGIVLNGALWRGPGGMAGEFGHICVGHAETCGCGATGCLEAVASARAMERLSELELGRAAPLPEIADLARGGNAGAQRVFAHAGAYFGEALATVALLLDLRVFLVGGGGAPVLDLLRPHALAVLDRRAFGRRAADFTLLPARLGNDAGILGAAML